MIQRFNDGRERTLLPCGDGKTLAFAEPIGKAPFALPDGRSARAFLADWWAANAPDELKKGYDASLPEITDLFPQRYLDVAYGPYDHCVGRPAPESAQLPAFSPTEGRMMSSDGKPVVWWTGTAVEPAWGSQSGPKGWAWAVDRGGSLILARAQTELWVVPILRKKEPRARKVRIGDLTIRETVAICKDHWDGLKDDPCAGCPLSASAACFAERFDVDGKGLDEEVSVRV